MKPARRRSSYDNFLVVSLTAGLVFSTFPIQASYAETIEYNFDQSQPVHAPKSDTYFQNIYDANGNLKTTSYAGTTTEYLYTTFNKLKEVKENNQPISGYLYDVNGVRIAKKDGEGNTIERYFGEIEQTETGINKYYFLGGTRVAKRKSNSSLHFFHQDHLGSASVVADRSGQPILNRKYYEFGAVKSEVGTDNEAHAYNDKRWNKETDFFDYDARSYAAKSFRFAQPDSIVPNSSDPQSFNRYSYVNNNPLRYIDPTGHLPDPATLTPVDGHGGTSSLYQDPSTGEAVKLPVYGNLDDPEIRMHVIEDFAQTNQALANLEENGVPVADQRLVVDGDLVYFRGEFVDGFTRDYLVMATEQGVELPGMGGLESQQHLIGKADQVMENSGRFAHDIHGGNVMVEKETGRVLVVDANLHPNLRIGQSVLRKASSLRPDVETILTAVGQAASGNPSGAAVTLGTDVAVGAGISAAASRWSWVGTAAKTFGTTMMVATELLPRASCDGRLSPSISSHEIEQSAIISVPRYRHGGPLVRFRRPVSGGSH